MASLNQTISKIRSFATLPDGWHYGDGGPIGYDAREAAIRLTRKAAEFGIHRADAFPGVNGEISVNFYSGATTLAIRREDDGTFSIIEDVNNKVVKDDYELSEAEADQRLWDFSLISRITSVLSTSNIGNQNDRDLATLLLRSRLHRRAEQPQSFQLSVSPQPDTPYALISGSGTPQTL